LVNTDVANTYRISNISLSDSERNQSNGSTEQKKQGF